MNTRAVNSAAGVIHAALKQCQTAAGIAVALESAGLLMSPEAAKDIASVSTEAVRVAEAAVAELKREHGISADLRKERDQAHDNLTGSNLSLYEEELETARLRLALKSAQRGRRELRAEAAALRAERHSTNAALADVTVALRENVPARENLGAWLYEQFVPAANPASWERLSKADRAYWEQRAVIVRRAVARDGTR